MHEFEGDPGIISKESLTVASHEPCSLGATDDFGGTR